MKLNENQINDDRKMIWYSYYEVFKNDNDL